MNCIMKLLKKYWWWILIVLAAPVVINYILLVPAISPIVGDNAIWLSFWGSYLGAIISATVAFIILHIQRKDNEIENEKNRVDNETENNNNRNLQLNILKYQQEMQWLNAFRQMSAEYVSAYNYNDLIHIVNISRSDAEGAFNGIGPLLDRLALCDVRLKYIGVRGNKASSLCDICDAFFELYNDVLYDLQAVFIYSIENPSPMYEAFCIQSTRMPITKSMKMIIQQVAIEKGLSNAQRFNDVIMGRIKIIEERAEKIRTVFAGYILEEQKRIDNILTENLS